MPTWNDRFPFLGSAGRVKIKARFEQCYPAVAKELGLSLDQLTSAKALGCGNYGCTILVSGLPKEKSVLKATSDNLEANVVQLLTEWGEKKPQGIAHYEGIWILGDCSKLARMQPFKFSANKRVPYEVSGRTYYEWRRVTEYYKGPGAPYRPVWLIQREELPDVDSHFKGKLKSKSNRTATGSGDYNKPESLQDFLSLLNEWAHKRAVDYGISASKGWGARWHAGPTDDIINAAAEKFHALELVNALDWLYERDIGFFDFTKIANLGWRDGTGLVIRDIGFASTEMVSGEDTKQLGTFGDKFDFLK